MSTAPKLPPQHGAAEADFSQAVAACEKSGLTARNIEDVVESAVTGNRKLLIRTLRRDPLMKNMASRKIPELVGRLLELNR